MSMPKRMTLLWVFSILAAVQVWVPLSMIGRREATLRNGTAFKFQTRPVDPYDAFRGRFVRLVFESQNATVTNAADFARGQTVYVAVEVGTNGYAQLGEATPTRPRGGDYLRTSVTYRRNSQSNEIRVKLPFDRFYMNEDEAPEAERQFRRAGRRETRSAHALVRVRDGMAVIEDLYIEDRPILEFMKQDTE
jgi:uncharacterized membrane-anchored protein